MIPKTLVEIMGEMQVETRNQFGEDFHVSETSDWYRENMPVAMALKMLWDSLLDAESNTDLRTASDPYFFMKASNYLFYRKMPTKAKGVVKTTDSTIGATARAGEIKLKKVGTDIIYTNTQDITVNKQEFEFEVESIDTGEITNANIGEVTQVISTPPNWKTFTNITEIAGGQDIEELEDARKRFFTPANSQSYWNVDGIRAELYRVDGVKSAYVKANNTDNFIGSQPRRSIWCVVDGGRDEDIAQAIFRKFTDATFTYGSQKVTILDQAGTEVEICFDRPSEIMVDIQVEVLGMEQTDSLKEHIKEYLADVPVGSVVSSSQALLSIPNYQSYQNIDIKFKKQSTSSWVSFIQLGATEKAKYGVV